MAGENVYGLTQEMGTQVESQTLSEFSSGAVSLEKPGQLAFTDKSTAGEKCVQRGVRRPEVSHSSIQIRAVCRNQQSPGD